MRTLLSLCVLILFVSCGWGQQMNAVPTNSASYPSRHHREPGRLPASVVPQAKQHPPVTIAARQEKEKLTTFDPRSVEIRWVDGRWEVYAGSVWLKNCQQNRLLARQCSDLIRQLGVNQRGTVGSPHAIMEYWLVNGQAPTRRSRNMRLWDIDLPTLGVKNVVGDWCVVDKRKLYFNFGKNQSDAEKAARIFHQYRFDKVGYVGSPRPVMIYFLGSGANHTTQQVHYTTPAKRQKAEQPKTTTHRSWIEKVRGAASPKAKAKLRTGQLYLKQMARSAKQLSAPPLQGGTIVRFEPRHLLLRQENGAWKVYFRNQVLANFGPDVQAAHKLLQMIRYYRCNQQVWLQQSQQKICYFLTSGRAPRGFKFGLSGQRFRPHSAKLKQIGHHWYLASADGQPMLFISDSEETAKQLLAAIRRYRFDFLTHIGTNGEYSMPFFLRSR